MCCVHQPPTAPAPAMPQVVSTMAAAAPATMRFRVVYRFASISSANQALVKNTIMPTVLKTFDKYFKVSSHPAATLQTSTVRHAFQPWICCRMMACGGLEPVDTNKARGAHASAVAQPLRSCCAAGAQLLYGWCTAVERPPCNRCAAISTYHSGRPPPRWYAQGSTSGLPGPGPA